LRSKIKSGKLKQIDFFTSSSPGIPKDLTSPRENAQSA
jgi:hypothetical protein